MKLKEIADALNLQLLTKDLSDDALYTEVEGGYVSDLLSNTMGQAQGGMLWVTMQGHQNVAAVATLLGLAGVIVAGDAPVADDMLHKASVSDVAVFSTKLSAYDVVGKLYTMGVVNAE